MNCIVNWKKYGFSNLKFILCFLFFPMFFYSCISTQNVPYFKDISDTSKPVSVVMSAYNDPIIQIDDILSVNIQTIDPQASAPISQSNIANLSATSSTLPPMPSSTGYLVDKEGTISIPLLGTIKVAGLTTAKARKVILTKAEEFYKSPTVQVRYENFKVTILGEVQRPSSYAIPNERITVLDALGLAGDLTIYGRRENIMLIRDSLGSKQFIRLNLNSTELVKSPYFYLKQNDVLYVEPNKAKIATTDAAKAKTLTIIATALSVLIVIASRLIK